jgi:glyoxylase-like metal-dependent hydrolase (beta-lactamase superfamily II)
MPPLSVVTLEVGNLETGCYLLARPGETAAAVVDPGGEAATIRDALQRRDLVPALILVTHSHFDHVGALGELKAFYPEAVVACHPECDRRMQSPQMNLGGLVGVSYKAPAADRHLADGEALSFPGVELTCLHVPGHAPGHMAYYGAADGVLFCGDTLFQGSVGRTDFEGCSYADLVESFRSRLLGLPDETRVYPGHGPATTLGEEKANNPFLREALS